MNKQIEEMVKDLDDIYSTDFKGDYESGLNDMAKRLIKKGYRKASDVAMEIFAEIEEMLNCLKKYNPYDNMINVVGQNFAELKKKYEREGVK